MLLSGRFCWRPARSILCLLTFRHANTPHSGIAIINVPQCGHSPNIHPCLSELVFFLK